MEDNISNKKMGKEDDEKNKNFFSNVFSNIPKPEKNKQYIILQSNINSLSNDVRLLHDYVNKDKFGKNKGNSSNKDNLYKKFVARSKFILDKNKGKRFTSILNILGNYIDAHQKQMEKSLIKNNRMKKKKSRMFNKTNDRHSILKTEIKNSANINLNKFPKILLNLKKSSKNIEKSHNNLYNKDTPKFPVIENKSSKSIYFLTEINENEGIIPKINYNEFYLPKKNININNNSFVQKYPNLINNERFKSSINRYELNRSADKIEKIIKDKNLKINRKINLKLAEENLIDWKIKSKIKLAKWKFGIPEIEKYFVDLNTYGKPEEEELLKRKTFYDTVEELIDDIKQTEEEKDIQNIKEEYIKKENKDFNKLDIKEKNNEEKNEFNMVDNAFNKHFEVSKALEVIKNRKMKEERTRQLINNILVNSDLRVKAINRSTDKLYSIKNKKEFINENKDNNTKQTEQKII